MSDLQAGAVKKCPICGKKTVEKFNPFCSARCAHLDLGQWLGEGYRVPVEEESEEIPALPRGGEDEGEA